MSSSGQQWLLTSSQADIAALILSLGACAFLAWVQTKHLTNVRVHSKLAKQKQVLLYFAHFRFPSTPENADFNICFLFILLLSFA